MASSGPSSEWFDQHTSFDPRREHPQVNEAVVLSLLGIQDMVERLRSAEAAGQDSNERQGLASWLSSSLYDLVKISEHSIYIPEFTNGELAITGRRMSGSYLYDPIEVAPATSHPLDYAGQHYVPYLYPHDLLDGFADSQQLFVGNTSNCLAISSKQLLSALLRPVSSAELTLKPRLPG
jgi:hypothetical protein